MNLANLDPKGHLNLLAVLIDAPVAVLCAVRGHPDYAIFMAVLAFLNAVFWTVKQRTPLS